MNLQGASGSKSSMENSSNSPDTLRSLLRSRIWPLHQRLDHSPFLQALTRSDLDATTYTRTLTHFHTTYQHLEPDLLALEQSVGPGNLPAYEPRLPYIRTEHAFFSNTESCPEKPETLLPPMPQFQCPLSAYLGSRYVLEGASQGTPHVMRALEKHHPAWPLHPRGYWHTLLKQEHAWHQLCQLLDSPQMRPTLELAELIRGATWVFESFIAALAPSKNLK
ncbi:MAG: hypothetical protein CML19_11660 [Pusillimonas sp.]|nr:hypothetical protein [Pusillimonas sp.]HCP77060.1 hypothetical protein [Pusillimonas sp.]